MSLQLLCILCAAGLLAAPATATYCLQSTSNPPQYTYCNSGYRCCPGYGCCSVSATCCYPPLTSYAGGCCSFGYSCCTDSYQILCCEDSSEECCFDDYGNAKCCTIGAGKTDVNQILYAVAVVLFACLVGAIAVCTHYRRRRISMTASRSDPSVVGITIANRRAQPNDFDNFDMLPEYKAQTPPPQYEDIMMQVNAIDQACGSDTPVQGNGATNSSNAQNEDHQSRDQRSRDLPGTCDISSFQRASVIVDTNSENAGPSGTATADHRAVSPIYEDTALDTDLNDMTHESAAHQEEEAVYEDPEDYLRRQTEL